MDIKYNFVVSYLKASTKKNNPLRSLKNYLPNKKTWTLQQYYSSINTEVLEGCFHYKP